MNIRARNQFPDIENQEPKLEDKNLIVLLTEFVEALNRSTKMKRAPAGAKSSGLKEGAFVPKPNGFLVEMPGGSSLVKTINGNLDKEIVFEASRIAPIAKALGTYKGVEENVQITVSDRGLIFQCATTKLSIPLET